MPLPTSSDAQWPPENLRGARDALREWAVWYEGNPHQLGSFYAGATTTRKSVLGGLWERTTTVQLPQQRQRVHMPLAADIAATSAHLLFGEPVALRVAAESGGDQQQADDFFAEANLDRILHEAAELAASLAGAWLRVLWDKRVSDTLPVVSVIDPEHVVPETVHGVPVEAVVWTRLDTPAGVSAGSAVYRHLERHAADETSGMGFMEHARYVGSETTIGVRVNLEQHPETAQLPEFTPMPFRGMAMVYLPNIGPARRLRRVPAARWMGRPDIEGLEGGLDALDEMWTSLVRDFRLGKARVITPHEYLDDVDQDDKSAGKTFDVDREAFAPLNIDPEAADRGGLTQVQFQIRTADHVGGIEQTARSLIEQAGWSPESFGWQSRGGGVESGVSRKLRERKSVQHVGVKRRYAGPAVRRVALLCGAVAAGPLGGSDPLGGQAPTVEWGDAWATDVPQRAQTVDMLARARAASTQERVRYVHPDWTDGQVAEEAARINEEDGAGLALPGLDELDGPGA